LRKTSAPQANKLPLYKDAVAAQRGKLWVLQHRFRANCPQSIALLAVVRTTEGKTFASIKFTFVYSYKAFASIYYTFVNSNKAFACK
jgi:hypothetical protein